jgi:hypothetical protein
MRCRSSDHPRRPTICGQNLTRLAVGLALLAIVSACGIAIGPRRSPVPPPTLAEALAYLDSVKVVVRTGDLSHLCDAFGGGNCARALRGADPAAVPTSDPIVIGTGIIPPATYANGTWSDGGRVLRLCGRDGLDRPYYSEMLVFNDGQRTISIEPTYWIGMRIATGPLTQASPAPPPPCPS